MTFSIARLNRLPKEERDRIYLELVPRSIFENYQIDPKTLIINDPLSERFNIDVDELGRDTLYGTRSRNLPEEIKAMKAGLAPGMVRRGLRLMREFVKVLDIFMDALGLKSITTNAFFSHNAILWEKYGFTYFRGGKMMEGIHKEFQPGGLLYEGLDDSTPFRMKGMEKTIRGRSWAVYEAS